LVEKNEIKEKKIVWKPKLNFHPFCGFKEKESKKKKSKRHGALIIDIILFYFKVKLIILLWEKNKITNLILYNL
jgi:hypothetical protein